jgi:hypothetical protein
MEWQIQTQLVALRENFWGKAYQTEKHQKARVLRCFSLRARRTVLAEILRFSTKKCAH